MINPQPKEQVSETADVVFKDVLSSLQPTPVLPIEHQILPIEHPVLQEVILNVPQIIDNNSDDVIDVDIPNKHKLPPSSTRGIPPRRYDLEFEAQRSRYPINKESN